VKKILFLTILILIAFVGVFSFERISKNPESLIPYPYKFDQSVTTPIDSENIPILIIGDRLAFQLASYKDYLAEKISINLTKKVKILSMAQKGESLHRTLQRVKRLNKLPLITIYLGGSEEYYEKKFLSRDITTIENNFKLFSDDRIKTLLIIFPYLSKLIYEPISYRNFDEKILKDETEYTDTVALKRKMIGFEIYKEELNDLFSYMKDKGSYLFALTAPINYDTPPNKSCDGSLDEFTSKRFDEAIELIKIKDFKKAYSITKDLVLIANNNAKIFYIHGQVAESLGYQKEGQRSLEMGVSLDCTQWRGTPVHNAILRKMAKENEVVLFDFDKYLIKNRDNNTVFSDKIYPQGLYIEKVADILSDRIKRLLKL
jgi:hypothetical protein